MEQEKIDAPRNPKSEEEFWDKIKYLLNHKETSLLLKLFRSVFGFQRKFESLIETTITLGVALFLIFVLKYFVDLDYLDKSAFGVMFGTVFGYLLSWRFGK